MSKSLTLVRACSGSAPSWDTPPRAANGAAHALELLGMGMAPDLRGQPRSDAVVALAQVQALFFGGLLQVLAAPLQQPTVGGVRNCLGRHGRVDDDTVPAGGLHDAAAPDCVAATIKSGFTPSSPMRFHQRVRLLGSLIRVIDLNLTLSFPSFVPPVLAAQRAGASPAGFTQVVAR
ncbi:hypothetical protein [Variovorax paradoxus]|uniref:hypothetical protein n=1 Tax=Variovorax paradoxus TaxID=34073 RepID=UPI0033949573